MNKLIFAIGIAVASTLTSTTTESEIHKTDNVKQTSGKIVEQVEHTSADTISAQNL